MLLGANWTNGSNAGSRASNWNNAPDNSNDNIGSRAACDTKNVALPRWHRYGESGRLLNKWSAISSSFGKHITGFVRTVRSEISRAGRNIYMAKRYRNLIAKIADKENLWLAYHKAAKGRKKSAGFLAFKEYDAAWIDRLHHSLLDGSYQPSKSRIFWVYEPKPRKISALPFKDRVVQHAIYAVINPIFDKTMLPQSYACRVGKGMHLGATDTQAMIRRHRAKYPDAHILKTDFSKYFHSVDRKVLWQQINKKISCRATLSLLERFTEKQGKGIPIGALTSQLWANVYGGLLDNFIQHTLKISQFTRYMDDLVLLAKDRLSARKAYIKIKAFAINVMGMRFSKWSIRHISYGADFLGFRMKADYKLLRKQSVTRAKRKIKKLSGDKRSRFLASWLGHAEWADSANLLNYLRGQNPCLQN